MSSERGTVMKSLTDQWGTLYNTWHPAPISLDSITPALAAFFEFLPQLPGTIRHHIETPYDVWVGQSASRPALHRPLWTWTIDFHVAMPHGWFTGTTHTVVTEWSELYQRWNISPETLQKMIRQGRPK